MWMSLFGPMGSMVTHWPMGSGVGRVGGRSADLPTEADNSDSILEQSGKCSNFQGFLLQI